MRGPRLIHLWGPLSHCCEGKNGMRWSSWENSKMTLWKCGQKKIQIIPGVPTITAFVAAFDAKALNCTELLRSYLAGGNRIINYHRKPTEIATIEILTKHMAYVFHKNHICFFLSVFKKKTKTLHLYSMCGGVKTKAQREEHVATRLLRL